MNARVRQLSSEERATIAAELDASLDDAGKQHERVRFEAAVRRVVKEHDAILAELAK